MPIQQRNTRKTLSDDAKKARMEQWAAKVNLPKETADKMLEKYGPYAYKIMQEAMLRPAVLMQKVGKRMTSSKNSIRYFLEKEPDTAELAKIFNRNELTIQRNLADHKISVVQPAKPQNKIDEATEAAKKKAEEAQNSLEARVRARESTTSEAPSQEQPQEVLSPVGNHTPAHPTETLSEYTIKNMSVHPAENFNDLQNEAYENFTLSEAKRADIYLDCYGHPTTGVGHLIFHLDDLNNEKQMQKWRSAYLKNCTYPNMTKEQQGELFDHLAEQMKKAKNYQKQHKCTLDEALQTTDLGTKNINNRGWDLTSAYMQKARLTEDGIRKTFNNDFKYWYNRTKDKIPQLDSYPLAVQLSTIHFAFGGRLKRLSEEACTGGASKLVEEISSILNLKRIPSAEGDTLNIARMSVGLPKIASRSSERAYALAKKKADRAHA